MRIALIILAAGASRRFGRENKLLADYSGEPLIVHGVRILQGVGLAGVETEVSAVVAESGDVPAALRRMRAPPRLVVNPRPERGIGSSIAAGIRAVDETVDGALIVPGDMPHVTPDLIGRLIGAFVAAHGEVPAHPIRGDGQGVGPVVWPRSRFAELAALDGDAGGKGLLDKTPTAGVQLGAAEADWLLVDIDTPDDLVRLKP